MSHGFRFHPEARTELRESIRHYETEAAGLGAEFAAEVRQAIERARENPCASASSEAETRREVLQRFPYSLIYLVEGEQIFIILQSHSSEPPRTGTSTSSSR